MTCQKKTARSKAPVSSAKGRISMALSCPVPLRFSARKAAEIKERRLRAASEGSNNGQMMVKSKDM